ncbi:MAG: DMT family transporter [Pseudomonadota bacterium]
MRQLVLIFMIIALGLCWGLNFSLIKFAALTGLDHTLIAGLVILGNAAIFTGFSLLSNGRIRLHRSTWLFFLGCGFIGYVLPFFLELFSAPRIGASVLSLVVSLAPIMTLVFSAMARMDNITTRKFFGIALGFVSVATLALQDVASLQTVFGAAFLAALIVPFCYAAYHIFIARFWPDGYKAYQVATGESIGAMFMMVPIYIFWHGDWSVPGLGFSTYWAISALVVLTAIEVWLYFKVMQLGGPVFASQAGYIAVISGVVWGAVLFSEPLSAWLALSMAILIIALFLVAPGREVKGTTEN